MHTFAERQQQKQLITTIYTFAERQKLKQLNTIFF